FIQAVVVIDVEKAARQQPAAQRGHFSLGKRDVAVSGDVQERKVPEFGICQCHHLFPCCGGDRRPFPDGGQQVGQRRRVGIPIAAAIVVQPANGGRGHLCERHSRTPHQQRGQAQQRGAVHASITRR